MEDRFDPAWINSIEPAEVYKQDQRSRVWRIDAPNGRAYVIKRFEFNPIRQALGILLGVHPGQSERRLSHQLIQAGIPVVPVMATGVQSAGPGRRFWLTTPWTGTSLFNLLYHHQLGDPDRRAKVMDATGRLTGLLIAKDYFNRDHKASNILIDDQGSALLIDYGAVRRHRGQQDTDRMLNNLCSNLAEAGADGADLDRVRAACRPGPGAD